LTQVHSPDLRLAPAYIVVRPIPRHGSMIRARVTLVYPMGVEQTRIRVNGCGARVGTSPGRISLRDPRGSGAGTACRPPPVQDLVPMMPGVVRGTAMLLACLFRSKSWTSTGLGGEAPRRRLVPRGTGVDPPRCPYRDGCSPAVCRQTTRRGAAGFGADRRPKRLLRIPCPPSRKQVLEGAGGGLGTLVGFTRTHCSYDTAHDATPRRCGRSQYFALLGPRG
jgi:hypothetical protein